MLTTWGVRPKNRMCHLSGQITSDNGSLFLTYCVSPEVYCNGRPHGALTSLQSSILCASPCVVWARLITVLTVKTMTTNITMSHWIKEHLYTTGCRWGLFQQLSGSWKSSITHSFNSTGLDWNYSSVLMTANLYFVKVLWRYVNSSKFISANLFLHR